MPGGGAPWVAGCCATVRKKKTNHGLNGYLEMQQLHEAGLSLEQIFQAATINNAREFKLDSQVGTIEPGKIANLVLLRKSPLVSRTPTTASRRCGFTESRCHARAWPPSPETSIASQTPGCSAHFGPLHARSSSGS